MSKWSAARHQDEGRTEASVQVVAGYTFQVVKRTFNTGYSTRHTTRYEIPAVTRPDGSAVDCSAWYNGSPRFGLTAAGTPRIAGAHIRELNAHMQDIVAFDALSPEAQATEPAFDLF